MVHGPLHHPRALHHLREEHPALAKQVTDRLHASHQRSLDDLEAGGVLLPGRLHVFLDIVGDPLDQSMGHPLLDRHAPPGVGGRNLGRIPPLDRLGEFDEPFRGVGPAVEQHVFDPGLELGFDLLVEGQLAGIDDPHLHPRLDRVIEEAGVHRLADSVVAAK